jgi:hypothetical protein
VHPCPPLPMRACMRHAAGYLGTQMVSYPRPVNSDPWCHPGLVDPSLPGLAHVTNVTYVSWGQTLTMLYVMGAAHIARCVLKAVGARVRPPAPSRGGLSLLLTGGCARLLSGRWTAFPGTRLVGPMPGSRQRVPLAASACLFEKAPPPLPLPASQCLW